MAGEPDDLVDSLAGLRLAGVASKQSDSHSAHPASRQKLLDATRRLIHGAELVAAQARELLSAQSANTQGGQNIARLSALNQQVNALTDTAASLSSATDRYILSYITSLAGPSTIVPKLLSHFSSELKKIIQTVLDNSYDEYGALREILECCCNQTTDKSGTLRYETYDAAQAEAGRKSPHDPDLKSQAQSMHKDRLILDALFYEHSLRKFEDDKRRKTEEGAWIGFWIEALNKCPNGPTLFHPPPSRRPQPDLSNVPRYLFRTFDEESSGRNDDKIIASAESLSEEPQRSRIDLFARTDKEAVKMLHWHLTNISFEGADDNLISWSSSLPFVIQYAIWRCHRHYRAPDKVKICVVDTSKFPRGQFARDRQLIRAYRRDWEHDEHMSYFFNFRLDREEYDNGEYLSQGTVRHAGRSCVFTLDQLVKAGLYDLYPEFSDESANGRWTNRVRDLRFYWSARRPTTTLDIQTAIKISKDCFFPFKVTDIAFLILSFKERELRVSTLQNRNLPDYFFKSIGNREPIEVERYRAALGTETASYHGNSSDVPGFFACLHSSDPGRLGGYYKLTSTDSINQVL